MTRGEFDKLKEFERSLGISAYAWAIAWNTYFTDYFPKMTKEEKSSFDARQFFEFPGVAIYLFLEIFKQTSLNSSEMDEKRIVDGFIKTVKLLSSSSEEKINKKERDKFFDNMRDSVYETVKSGIEGGTMLLQIAGYIKKLIPSRLGLSTNNYLGMAGDLLSNLLELYRSEIAKSLYFREETIDRKIVKSGSIFGDIEGKMIIFAEVFKVELKVVHKKNFLVKTNFIFNVHGPESAVLTFVRVVNELSEVKYL